MGPQTHETSEAVSIEQCPGPLQFCAGPPQHVVVLGRLGWRVAQELQLELRTRGFLVFATCA
jgi:hypothetical protein